MHNAKCNNYLITLIKMPHHTLLLWGSALSHIITHYSVCQKGNQVLQIVHIFPGVIATVLQLSIWTVYKFSFYPSKGASLYFCWTWLELCTLSVIFFPKVWSHLIKWSLALCLTWMKTEMAASFPENCLIYK